MCVTGGVVLKRVLVIADDLTGAAEIAGVGLRYGMTPRLVRGKAGRCEPGLTVIDTDSRMLSPADAAAVIKRRIYELSAADPVGFPAGFDLIFKKTDSVLRGPVMAELEAMMAGLRRPAALLVPQNPSRGRAIENNEYHIDGLPLYATAFANDPEYPARTADVLELLGKPAAHTIGVVDAGEPLPLNGISVGAGGAEQVKQWAARARGNILLAGAADFFVALLEHQGMTFRKRFITDVPVGPMLLVCGSASAYGRNELIARAEHKGVMISPMPDDVFDAGTQAAASLRTWCDQAVSVLRSSGRVLLTIPQPPDRSPEAPQRIQDAIAEAAACILKAAQSVSGLTIEGGGTASAVCRRMGWDHFDVTGELATGVVQLKVTGAGEAPTVLIKPGSYRWPDALWDVPRQRHA